jgi:ribonuclease P protein component
MKKYTLKKQERLYKRKEIEELFRQNKVIKAYPFILFHHQLKDEDQTGPLKFGVSVPKRKIKKAVDRNLLKRRIREAYRLQCPDLKNYFRGQEKTVHLMFVYTHHEILSYGQIEDKIILLLRRLLSEYE